MINRIREILRDSFLTDTPQQSSLSPLTRPSALAQANQSEAVPPRVEIEPKGDLMKAVKDSRIGQNSEDSSASQTNQAESPFFNLPYELIIKIVQPLEINDIGRLHQCLGLPKASHKDNSLSSVILKLAEQKIQIAIPSMKASVDNLKLLARWASNKNNLNQAILNAAEIKLLELIDGINNDGRFIDNINKLKPLASNLNLCPEIREAAKVKLIRIIESSNFAIHSRELIKLASIKNIDTESEQIKAIYGAANTKLQEVIPLLIAVNIPFLTELTNPHFSQETQALAKIKIQSFSQSIINPPHTGRYII